MSFIQDKALLIVVLLLVLVIIEGLIIYVQHKTRPKTKGKHKSGSPASVPKGKYDKICEELEDIRSERTQLKKELKAKEKECGELNVKYQRNKDDYGRVIVENQMLKQAIDDLKAEKLSLENIAGALTRDNAELNKLFEKDSVPNVTESVTTVIPTSTIPEPLSKEESINKVSTQSSQPVAEEVSSVEVKPKENVSEAEPKVEPTREEPKAEPTKEELKVGPTKVEQKEESSKEKTMYASFPRSAGNSSYFSDLSETFVDDSYFEFKVSVLSGKATFKPLDFMKIRNYDPAMVAMRTEGAKPNVASTVLGIEPGKAHIEGKDWIIDNLAIIKLA